MEDLSYGSPAYNARIDYYYQLLNEKLAKSSRVEARLMGIDMLPRVLVALEAHSHSCNDCKLHLERWQQTIDVLHKAIDQNDLDTRKNYETQGAAVIQHLKNGHGLVPRGKTVSKISLWAMLGGMAIGAAAALFGLLASWGTGIILGWLFGTMAGTIAGRIAEARLRKKHLLY